MVKKEVSVIRNIRHCDFCDSPESEVFMLKCPICEKDMCAKCRILVIESKCGYHSFTTCPDCSKKYDFASINETMEKIIALDDERVKLNNKIEKLTKELGKDINKLNNKFKKESEKSLT